MIDEPTVGDVLAGRYRLVERAGSGGMAHVYRADDLALGRVVAVKVVHAHGAEQAGHDRIRGEVNLLASVSGHSLVTLLDAHVGAGGPAYLVMEYVDGPTLATRLGDGRLSVEEVDALADDLAEALHVVHGAGIVHRDVKPSNVLLTGSGSPLRPLRAKLADFGIAHLLDSTRVTTPGLTVGTAAYIAPELLDGADPAPPSDIYALGLVLIEAASGHRAFGTTDARAQVLARLTRDPDMPASLGPDRRSLLSRMTARDPRERPSAREILEALAALPPAHAIAADEITAPVRIAASPALTAPFAPTGALTPTAVLPAATGAPVVAAAMAADTPLTRTHAHGRPHPPRPALRRAPVWLSCAAAAVIISAFAWSASVGASPTVNPTPRASLTAIVPVNVADETPAPSDVAGDGASTIADQDSTGDDATAAETASDVTPADPAGPAGRAAKAKGPGPGDTGKDPKEKVKPGNGPGKP